MRDKIYLKRKKKKKISSYFTLIIIILILSILASFYIISYFSNLIHDNASMYGEEQARKFISLVINNSLSDEDKDNIDINTLMNIDKNDKGEIVLITYKTNEVLTLLNNITNKIQTNLLTIEQGNISKLDLPTTYDRVKLKKGIIYEIPIGLITNNLFLNNLGVKIPVKYSFIGDITSNIMTKVVSYGINNALIEVDVHVEVSLMLYLPFISERITISNEVPISLKVIQGSVPSYYLNGFTTNSASVQSNSN